MFEDLNSDMLLISGEAIRDGKIEDLNDYLKMGLRNKITPRFKQRIDVKVLNQPIMDCLHSEKRLTMLGLAALHGQLEMAKYLIEYCKVDCDATDEEGNTALHQCVIGALPSPNNHHNIMHTQHSEIAQLLLRHGVNVSIKNNEGDTASDLAKRLMASDSQHSINHNTTLKTLTMQNNAPENVTIFFKKTKKVSFKTFCLINACDLYIKKNELSYGFNNPIDFLEAVGTTHKKNQLQIHSILTAQNTQLDKQMTNDLNAQSIRQNIIIGILNLYGFLGLAIYMNINTENEESTYLLPALLTSIVMVTAAFAHNPAQQNLALKQAQDKKERIFDVKNQMLFYSPTKVADNKYDSMPVSAHTSALT